MLRLASLAALLAAGCTDGGSSGPDGQGDLTWHGAVAPLMAEKCGDCHYDGGPAPFDARDLEQVRSWAPAILDAIATDRMPPFAARRTDECQPDVWFKDDGSLSDEQRATLEDWVAADMPEGKAKNALPVPERVVHDLVDPDAVLGFQEPFAVGGTSDVYQCFRVEVPADGDRWITGMQVLPGNEKVVHHVLVWSDPGDESLARGGADGTYPCSGEPDVWPTELIGTWTPGGSPMITPENTGVTLRNGSSIVVNVHYHPTGVSTEIDDTRIALKWTDERPESFATWYLVDLPFGAQEATAPFEIPAGAEAHVEEVVLTNPLPFDVPIFAIAPHMHYLGEGMKVTLEHGNQDTCLVHTPRYRFDFQQSYFYDAPISQLPVLRFGDRVRVQCTYNNSMSNPYMPLALQATGTDAPVDVTWGEWTADEMCMAMAGLVSPVEILDLLELF
ncbi:MAG: hypothetical protein H6737_03480 [Alphaproteobacteria bacterium]|nr:hypothetical protein [Alphaproteobacteria bacterium]